ncbi:MAG: TlpA family protein disulfide reductase [Bacteroidales bacterium]|jgi:thiol-disulfide isomerase/thioredoxin|nr:TlpA family protein disulfide reductase [Bacteroidales bacterium]
MKKLFALLVAVLVGFGVQAQQKSDLPNVTIKNLQGKDVNIAKLSNNGKPFVMTFWATWCGPCIKEHNALDEVYQDWKDETGVKIYSVSIDDSRSTAKVKPFVEGKGWEFEVLLDVNKDLARAMNVNNPPYTFLFDGQGKLVYQHSGYFEGAENDLYEEILKAAGKKK